MARENRRKREGRRFGKPELLADKIGVLPFGMPADARAAGVGDEFKQRCLDMTALASRAMVIEASNVADYFFRSKDADKFDWQRDIPAWLPPFNVTWIEAKRGENFYSDSEFPEEFPVRWGWLINLLRPIGPPAPGDPRVPQFIGGKRSLVAMPLDESSDRMGLTYTYEFPDETRYIIHAMLIEEHPRGWVDVGECSFVAPLDQLGRLIAVPEFAVANMRREGPSEADFGIRKSRYLAAPIFLSLTFLHCKNVTLGAVQPDAALNRERRRGGLKPFLRYHTIDIEPMKEVLRTEGGIEANGLRKALHIARGHFATYTAEKPLFGHYVGTVWRPAHVRGTVKEGVVVSDYRVHPPEAPK